MNRLKRRFSKTQENPCSTHETEEVSDYLSFPLPDVETVKTTTKLEDNNEPLSKRKINEMMEDKLLEGLEQPLPSSSKGFKLLGKFGYTEGKGLGKHEQGAHIPLQLNVKPKKEGIGIRQQVGNKISKKMKLEQQSKQFNQDLLVLRNEKSNDLFTKQMIRDIYEASRIIKELDEKHNISYHELWPVSDAEKSTLTEKSDNNLEEDDIQQHDRYHTNYVLDDDNDDNSENYLLNEEQTQLPMKSNDDLLYERCFYLRSTYFYCIYCGCQYENEDDINNHCPGILRSDH